MRWTLFFENPNMTATALAELAVFFLCISGRVRAYLRWILIGATVFAVLLLSATGSRGGVLAFLSGVVVWALAKRREAPGAWRKIILPLGVVSVALFVSMVVGGLSNRFQAFATGKDPSVTNRLVIWRSVPRMMADAPNGWGVGTAGRVFMNWYQPLQRREHYRTLVGSHVTGLVEFGGIGRTLYLFGWFLVLALSFRRFQRRGDPLPAAQWTVLALAAIPTSVLEQRVLWLLPAACTLPLIGDLVRGGFLRQRTCWVLAVCAAVPQLLVYAARPGAVRCQEQGRVVTYSPSNADQIEDWLVPTARVVGDDFPRLLRQKGVALGLADSLAAVPCDARRLVVCEADARVPASQFPHAEEIVYLAPRFRVLPDGTNASSRARERFVVGEFACVESSPRPGVTILPGVCEFMPEAVFQTDVVGHSTPLRGIECPTTAFGHLGD